jgi:hypothetical protein
MGVEAIEDFQELPLWFGCNILLDVAEPQYDVWGHLLPYFHCHERIFGHGIRGADRTTIFVKEGISISCNIARSVQRNGRAAVCCLLLVLLSVGGANNFHPTVVIIGQQVGLITPSDEVVDELPKRFP